MHQKYNTLALFWITVILLGCSFNLISQDYSKEFEEPFSESYSIRVEQHVEIMEYIKNLRTEKIQEALTKFTPDFSSVEEYQKSIYPYQIKLERHLGLIPYKTINNGKITIEKIGEDKYKDIYRVWIEVIEGVNTYGIYMVPKNIKNKAPLIIAVHGGGGNPEAICGLDKRQPYHSFGYEAVKRGYIVWAPGLTMFSKFSGDSTIIHRSELDRQLRLMGSTLFGLEVHKIISSTKTLMNKRLEIDKQRIGMTGLSWGAVFTLYTTAICPFINVAAPSGNFRDTEKELNDIFDTSVNNSFFSINGFGHFETVGMICPRPILIQMGKHDTVIDINDSRKEVARASKFYEKLNYSDKFTFHVHEGGHEFEVNTILDFFDKNL